jgi:hypothetical protein
MKSIGLHFKAIPLVVVLLCLSSSAPAQKVRYNFAAGTEFSKYKTYKWVRIENAQYPNQLIDEQIMQAIDAQLAQKGLSKTEGNSDLVVTYQAAVNQQRQWNAYSTGGGYWGYGGWGGWGGMETTTVTSSTIDIGSLNLDMYDVTLRKQVWRGEATKTLDPPKDPAKLQKNINKAMAKLLKNYPPGSGK